MSTILTLSGNVIDKGTEKRLSGATVRLVTPTQVLFQETDKNGKYSFPGIDEPELAEGQLNYEVSLYTYYKDGRQQEPAPLVVTIDKGKTVQFQTIEMVNRGPISNSAGRVFLVILVVLLVAFTYVYYSMHEKDADESEGRVNTEIVNTLTESLVDRITLDSIKVSAFKLTNSKMDSTDLEFMNAEFEQLKDAADVLFKASQMDEALQALIKRNYQDIGQAIKNQNKEGIIAALSTSKTYIQKGHHLKSAWFWETPPNTYYEIVFWALFATLLRLIGNTSFYVSRNIFYRDSIPHKAVLLFTIPLIALLITIVISFFKITINIGGAAISLNFSDPYFSIILASLIGLAPWKAWEFMYGLADLFFNQLKKWVSINSKSGDEVSEGREPSSPVEPGADESDDPEVPEDTDKPTKPEVPTPADPPAEPEVPAKPNPPTDANS